MRTTIHVTRVPITCSTIVTLWTWRYDEDASMCTVQSHVSLSHICCMIDIWIERDVATMRYSFSTRSVEKKTIWSGQGQSILLFFFVSLLLFHIYGNLCVRAYEYLMMVFMCDVTFHVLCLVSCALCFVRLRLFIANFIFDFFELANNNISSIIVSIYILVCIVFTVHSSMRTLHDVCVWECFA